MFRPFLVVGIGGSGGKTLRAARQTLQYKLDLQGWDGEWPEAWQFLHIDTPPTPDGLEFPAPRLPRADYLSVVPNGVGYKLIYDAALQGQNAKLTRDIQRYLPSPSDLVPPINPPPHRGFGRTVVVASMKDIHYKVRHALGRMQSTSADTQLKEITRLFGAEVSKAQDPIIVVICSLAGQSGGGMFIDVTEAIKAAIGPKPSANQIFSLLFSPDVFAELGSSLLSSMVPNTMAAVSELISGYWRNNPTEGTLAIYKKHGLSVPQDVKSTIGPACNYIIGRKTSGANPVDFESQTGLYKALATSVAAWMTDAAIQNGMSSYAVAAGRSIAPSLPDRTGLTTGSASQPLSSLGFARVSLGTETFFEYAAERVAKQTLNKLLSQHTSTDPELKEKKEEEWIEYYTDLNEGSFIADSGLDEPTKETNHIVEALAPDIAELQERFKRAINTAATSDMAASGHSSEEWASLMVRAYELNLPGFLDNLSKLWHEKAREWVEKMPPRVLALVSKTISEHGIAVTAKLLERLANQTKAGAGKLIMEQSVHLGDSGGINHIVSRVMKPAAQMTAIPSDHPTVVQGLHEVELAFYWALMAEVKAGASELMLDFSKNFLEPLHLTLSSGFFGLKDSTANPKLLDNTDNPFARWPDFAQTGVANRFMPAPNESMLIDIKDFPAEFDALVEQTVNDPAVPASRVVVDEVLMGRPSAEVGKLQENRQWEMLTLGQVWIPKDQSYRQHQAANQSAKFDFITDHMQYLEFAKRWIKMPGRAFRGFLDQTISSYLRADGNQAAQSERSKKFAAAVKSAIQSANPLVDLDQRLLEATHGQVGRMAISSGIPIEKTDPLRRDIDNALLDNGYAPSDDWYISGRKAANAKSIEIITQLTNAISPIPMASLMKPIFEGWSKAGHSYSARSNFMLWTRARTLAEAIPAHPEQWQAMLNGWFVARMLNLFELDKSDPWFREKGPRLSIWADPAAGWVDFPYPLHSAHIANNVDDFPAIVLDSMIVAMANCHAATSLQPLAPYQRLLDLGGSRGAWEDLSVWILDGEVQRGAPTPDPSRAGTPAGRPQERQDACAAYLKELLTKFRAKMAGLDSHADSSTYPIAWELRNEIESALDAGIKAVRSIEPPEKL